MMRLPPFTLHRTHDLDELLELLALYGDDAALFFGGTELLLVMKLGFASPAHLVDGKGVRELSALRVFEDRLEIGAGVTHRRLERHSDVARALPALAGMARRVANVRVRNVGTIGGNLCFAEPHSDPAALLLALDASVELVARGGGRRRLPLDGFIRGAFDTALAPGEVMTMLDVPVPVEGTVVGYERFVLKERPTVSVAVVHGPAASRVVVGAVGPRPIRVASAETHLTEGDLTAAAEAVTEAIARVDTAPGGDYRSHLAGVLTRRAWAAATPVRGHEADTAPARS